MGVWLFSWCWHIFSVLLIAGRGTSAKTCGLDDVFPPDDFCSRPQFLCWYIIICTYAFFIRVRVVGRVYTYTGSVVQYWWSCTPSQSIGLGRARFLCWMPLVFFLFSPIVSCSMMNRLKLGCLWPLVFVLSNTRYFAFCNISPPRMFLPLDLLWEYRIQHGAIGPLYVTSRYSTRIFYRGISCFITDCP